MLILNIYLCCLKEIYRKYVRYKTYFVSVLRSYSLYFIRLHTDHGSNHTGTYLALHANTNLRSVTRALGKKKKPEGEIYSLALHFSQVQYDQSDKRKNENYISVESKENNQKTQSCKNKIQKDVTMLKYNLS